MTTTDLLDIAAYYGGTIDEKYVKLIEEPKTDLL